MCVGSGMRMPLGVCMCARVQPAGMCGAVDGAHASWWGCMHVYVFRCACASVYVCVCMPCEHSSVCVCTPVDRYTLLSALSVSHALCSGSPLHLSLPAATLEVSVTLLDHSSQESRGEESAGAPPGAGADRASKGPACLPRLTLLLQPSRF